MTQSTSSRFVGQQSAQPVAYRSWFDADNGARWLFTLWPEEEKLEVDWQPLFTGPQQVERKYVCPVRTVADLANNLLMMDQDLPVYGAQYIEHEGRRRAIAVSPTVSRERVKDGRWIGEGDVLNAAIVWTRAAQPVDAGTVVMRPMEHEDGRKAWYIDHPEFYCDVEPDADGKWSVFFRDKQGREGFADQGTQPVEVQTSEVPDGVWEALQRLIENGALLGPASAEDALIVATYRDRVKFMAAKPAQPLEVQQATPRTPCPYCSNRSTKPLVVPCFGCGQ